MAQHIATRGHTSISPITQQEIDHLQALRRQVKPEGVGVYFLSTELVPFGRERKRLEDLHRDMQVRLSLPAAPDQREQHRRMIHDRLHSFLAGFSQLRSADAAAAQMMLADFVEAVEDVPLEVVHRACKAWNKRQFEWPNYSFPPSPPDFRRAANEIKVGMEIRRHDLNVLLIAKPGMPDEERTISEEERLIVARAMAEFLVGRSMLDENGKPRSLESPTEIAGAREALIRDGVHKLKEIGRDPSMSRLMARLDEKRIQATAE